MKMNQQCLIVGGSHAGAQVAISLRQAGWDGRILIISDEPHLPYHRPPLSKGFISGHKTIDDVLLRPASYFEKHSIEFLQNTTVKRIDREKKKLELDNGEILDYHKLALTTGARPRKVELPGSDLAGIHYLRTATDAIDIMRGTKRAKKAIIVGGGYIGLELAASFRQANLDVTVLEMAPRVLARVAAEEVSAFYARVHSEEGVKILTGVSAAEFTGSASVSAVVGTNGETYEADLVIVGIGVLPNTELASDAGLAIENGIVVDEFAQTSDKHIVAAGDCTFHPNALLNQSIRLESVPNATEQAKTAAASMCGTQKPYASIPWFWSDQFDLKLQIAGLNQDYDEVIVRGNADSSRSIAAFYLKKGQVIAADCINRAPEFALVKKALTKGLQIRVDELANEAIKPRDLLIENET